MRPIKKWEVEMLGNIHLLKQKIDLISVAK